jgi:hypothetical protein
MHWLDYISDSGVSKYVCVHCSIALYACVGLIIFQILAKVSVYVCIVV